MTKIDYRKQTTIVTGASSGLGAEFARQLAARGSNLVLVVRRADRLESLAEELTRDHGITVTVIARDLGQPDAGRALRAELESRGIHATSLVNNAGFGTHDAFKDEDAARLQSMIALNVGALVDLSRAYIDPLTSAGSGVLINVASLLGFQPTPYMSVYGATKAFVLSFTEGLWEESAEADCASWLYAPVRWTPSSSTPPVARQLTTARSDSHLRPSSRQPSQPWTAVPHRRR